MKMIRPGAADSLHPECLEERVDRHAVKRVTWNFENSSGGSVARSAAELMRSSTHFPPASRASCRIAARFSTGRMVPPSSLTRPVPSHGSGNLNGNGKEDRLGSLKFRLPVALPLAKPASRRFGSFVALWLESWFWCGDGDSRCGHEGRGIPESVFVV